jgi:hypothetical protein
MESVPAAAGDYGTAVANTQAEVSLGASAGNSHVISGVGWSYSGTPTGGNITITDGTSTISWDITAAGPGVIPFPRGKKFLSGQGVTIILAAGGSGVVGRVFALNHWLE